MGYVQHHAIVVTTWQEELIMEVREKAKGYFGDSVSNIVVSQINGYHSFFRLFGLLS